MDVAIEDVSERIGRARRCRARSSRAILAAARRAGPRGAQVLPPRSQTTIARHPGHDLAHRLHRRPGLRDLGRRRPRASPLWDALIEAGNAVRHHAGGHAGRSTSRGSRRGSIMLDVDYFSAHHALIEAQKSSPFELNLGWAVSADEGAVQRPRARSRPSARAGRRGASSGSRWTGTRSSGSTPSAACRRSSRTSRGARARRSTSDGPAGRLRDERLLVAAAQEVPRARAPRGAALRARDAGRDRGHGRAPAQAGRRASVRKLPFFDPERKKA